MGIVTEEEEKQKRMVSEEAERPMRSRSLYMVVCRFHPMTEAVTKCAACGAEMCSSCDTNAFFRVEKGALCLECSLERAQYGIEWKTNYLKRLKRKIIFASLFMIISIPFLIVFFGGDQNGNDLFAGALFWFLCGLIQTWGHENDKDSLKSALCGEKNKDEGGWLVKVIFYVFAAPVMLSRNYIDYFGTKAMKMADMQKYEKIKTTLDATKKQVFEYWKNEAEQGDSYSQSQLGVCYASGWGVAQDYGKAVEWYTKSANQGNPLGQFNLGGMYYYGNGVAQSCEKAIDLWTKAAEQGDCTAQFNLGLCYYEGTGVEKDYAKAAKLWELAAEQGFADAQRDLGICYSEGKGVVQDDAKALALWKMAAAQGDEEAQELLAQHS